jgi:hypothetical protein
MIEITRVPNTPLDPKRDADLCNFFAELGERDPRTVNKAEIVRGLLRAGLNGQTQTQRGALTAIDLDAIERIVEAVLSRYQLQVAPGEVREAIETEAIASSLDEAMPWD